MTITELSNGYKRITADNGYKLYNKATQMYYSEAEVADAKNFVAVKDDNDDNG